MLRQLFDERGMHAAEASSGPTGHEPDECIETLAVGGDPEIGRSPRG
jgi:hypothetical protein